MRISNEHVLFLKQTITGSLPDAAIYLIGSRVEDDLKGGDIDILVIGEHKLSGEEQRRIKIAFYKAFGEQKLDIVSFTRDDPSNFKTLALLDGTKI